MFSPSLLPGMIGGALLLLCGLAYLIRAKLRTRILDTCWHCGTAKVRPSGPQPLDRFAKLFLLRPYRCDSCQTRFYGFPSPSVGRPMRIRVNLKVESDAKTESRR